jgi:CARDB
MPTDQRRAAARRRAWGRGPMILRFEPLEERQLLSTATQPDLRPAAFSTVQNLQWGETFHATGEIVNAGAATTAKSFVVNIYASPTPGPSQYDVLLGQVTIPAGLAPGAIAPFDALVSLPAAPFDGMAQYAGLYIGDQIDPAGTIKEASTALSTLAGPGIDFDTVTVAPHQPAVLTGVSLNAFPSQAAWGNAVQLTAQIKNSGLGDAPATRARVVLTPAGATVGGSYDVTVANINVPAIAAGQTAVVTQSVVLPAAPPSSLAGSTQFILSLAEDADFATNQVGPHNASQGMGFDMFSLTIPTASDVSSLSSAKPELTATSVVAPTSALSLGQTIQVNSQIVNNSTVPVGTFVVRYFLVGTNGSLNQSIYLGDYLFNGGLAAGQGTNIKQALRLPTALPAGMTLNASSVARIAMVVDPEQTIDQTDRSLNMAVSKVVTISSTPVTPTSTTPAVVPVTPKTTSTAAPKRAAAKKAPKKKLPVTHKLDVLPNQVLKYLKGRLKI